MRDRKGEFSKKQIYSKYFRPSILLILFLSIAAFLNSQSDNKDINRASRERSNILQNKLRFNPYDTRKGEKARAESQSAPDRILVKYKKASGLTIQQTAKASVESTYGLKEIEHFSFINVYLYKPEFDTASHAKVL